MNGDCIARTKPGDRHLERVEWGFEQREGIAVLEDDGATGVDRAPQHITYNDRSVAYVEFPAADISGDPQLRPHRIGGRAAVQDDRPVACEVGLEHRQCALITAALHADAAVIDSSANGGP